jgi:dTDP-4-amino-4,6-dideoxygalactose transaminase
MNDRIHLSPPDVGEFELAAANRVILSGWVAPLGPEVDAFEAELAQRADVAHALALGSGTAALHLALLGLDVQPGDVVLVSTLTFAATAFAVAYVGARPHFVDAEPESGNINPQLLEQAIAECRSRGERIAAIVTVDLLGKVADYAAVQRIAADAGIPLLADAAESLGATREGRPAGSFGRAAVFSFNGNKIVTTSGGGALVSDDADLIARARFRATQAREPVAHYEHREIGYNYRLSNVLAAIGRAQLSRLDAMIDRRRGVRREYQAVFADVPGVRILGAADDSGDNCWLTSIIVDPALSGWDSWSLANALSEREIESRPLWKPMHLQPVFADASGTIDGTAERLFRNGITLPSGSSLRPDQLERVLGEIRQFLDRR